MAFPALQSSLGVTLLTPPHFPPTLAFVVVSPSSHPGRLLFVRALVFPLRVGFKNSPDSFFFFLSDLWPDPPRLGPLVWGCARLTVGEGGGGAAAVWPRCSVEDGWLRSQGLERCGVQGKAA